MKILGKLITLQLINNILYFMSQPKKKLQTVFNLLYLGITLTLLLFFFSGRAGLTSEDSYQIPFWALIITIVLAALLGLNPPFINKPK